MDNKVVATLTDRENCDTILDRGDIYGIQLINSGGRLDGVRLRRVPNIKMLQVSEMNDSIAHIFAGVQLSQLEVLNSYKSPGSLVDANGVLVGGKLRYVIVRCQQLSVGEFRWLASLALVQFFSITDVNLRDEHLCKLKSRESLKRLDIWKTGVKLEPALYTNITFPRVRSLDVSHCDMRNISCESLQSIFPCLERVVIRKSSIPRQVAEEMSRAVKLKVFDSDYADLNFDQTSDEFWDL